MANVTHSTPFRLLAFSALMVAACSGHAAQWKICRIDAKATGTVSRPYPKLQATVLRVASMQADAECPKVGDALTFIPDTADYQASVPRKRWPKAGSVFAMRYQYIDGECKNDGHPKPCRVEHYPLEGY